MTLLSSHREFFKRTSQLAVELESIENQVKQEEQQIFSNISALTLAVREMSTSASPGPVKEALTGYFRETSAVLEAWEKKVKSYDAGLTLRKRFGDSLLVFVYGKVKAGKSSLGNFIACGRSRPDERWLEQLAKTLHTPEYFGGETNQAFGETVNHRQGFQVGEAETTGCIQGFAVPGLTWIDSPGLHSVNSENGELAQKYVDSADLIIYPMNSAQPGRQSDLRELETLLSAGKRILVLITRCDSLEQDVDDEGNLVEQLEMKSAQSRHDQQQHVQGELDALCQKMGLQDADTSVLTVSVGYAEAHGNSEQAMQASGMQALFAKLQDILHSDGIALKKQVPRDNLQAFYRLLLSREGELGFTRLLEPLECALQQIDTLRAGLDDLRTQAQTKIDHDFAMGVESLVEQHASSRNTQVLGEALERRVHDAISTHYRQPLQELYEQALGTLQGVTQDMGLGVGLDFSTRTVDVTVDVSQKSAAVGTGAGAILGGIVGFLAGGPPGAAIGSTLGGLAGGVAGSAFNSQERRTIEVGDNREEVKTILLDKGSIQIETILNALHQQAIEEVISPMQSALLSVHRQTLVFQNNTKEQYRV